MRPAQVLTLLAALTSSSCLSDYGDAPFACAASEACPEGYLCLAKVCRRQGSSWLVEASVKPRDGGVKDKSRTGDKPFVQLDVVDKLPDLPAGKSCAQVLACYEGCPDQTCGDNCYKSVSPAAKPKLDALEACWDQALDDGCYNKCHPDGPGCDPCLDQVCASPLSICKAS